MRWRHGGLNLLMNNGICGPSKFLTVSVQLSICRSGRGYSELGSSIPGILLYCKDAIRDDKAAYDAFRRATIPERLSLLSQNCLGFVRGIDTRTAGYANFMRIISKRNFAIHGNVDPESEPIETVYFDGKRPLFVQPGTHIEKFFEHLEKLHSPEEAVEDYENAHAFLHKIVECLDARHRFHFDQVVNDPFPGFEVRKKRPTRILPDHVVSSILQGARYDDELNVGW